MLRVWAYSQVKAYARDTCHDSVTTAPLLLQLEQNLDPSAPARVDTVGSGLQAGGPLPSHCLGNVFTSSASPVEFILVRRATHVCLDFIKHYCRSTHCWSEACGLGSVLLAGFLRGPGRSNCISLKTIPGSGLLLWRAGIYSCLVVVLCCVVAWGPLGFPGGPHSVLLENLIPTFPTTLATPPAAPTSWDGFAPASEPLARMAGCGQENFEAQVCPENHRPERLCLPSVC